MVQLVYRSPERGLVIKADPKLGLIDQKRNLSNRVRAHVPYNQRNHDNDPVKPEESHKLRAKKSGDSCRCGGMNPSCPRCGGNGIIP